MSKYVQVNIYSIKKIYIYTVPAKSFVRLPFNQHVRRRRVLDRLRSVKPVGANNQELPIGLLVAPCHADQTATSPPCLRPLVMGLCGGCMKFHMASTAAGRLDQIEVWTDLEPLDGLILVSSTTCANSRTCSIL